MAHRPFIIVLAGVNGAGKSSIGGALISEAGIDWFNPDQFARELRRATGCSVKEANGAAWEFGRNGLAAAIENGSNFAFETTLGATTIPGLLRKASETHDVIVWFCGLTSIELHLDRVALRVAHGGHDIPPEKIRERYTNSIVNLIDLLPVIATLQVYDNSASVAPGQPAPRPKLILSMENGRVSVPDPSNLAELAEIPEWARPIVEAAFTRMGV